MSDNTNAEMEMALEHLLDLVARLIAQAHLRQAASTDRHVKCQDDGRGDGSAGQL